MSLQILVAVTLGLFALVLGLLSGTGALRQVGMAVLGNREEPLALSGWVARGFRAGDNLLFNLIPFAVVAFALHAAGLASGLSEAGALGFLVARATHAFAYVLGIKGLRTLAYNAGVAATFVTAAPLLGAVTDRL